MYMNFKLMIPRTLKLHVIKYGYVYCKYIFAFSKQFNIFMVGVINFSLEKMKLIERQINLKLTVGGGVLGKYFKINSNK